MKRLTGYMAALLLAATLLLGGCAKTPVTPDNTSSTETTTSLEKTTTDNTSSAGTTTSSAKTTATAVSSSKPIDEAQAVYMSFLKDLYKNEDSKDTLEFSLKDLDNNGIPELIIARNGVDITVYTFSGTLTKIGNHNFMTGTTRFLFSDNPSYPGILYFFVSGGLEHYGYITVKNNKLTDEKLWDEDYSGAYNESRDRIKEISTDKQLINESRLAYKENKDIKFSPFETIV